MNKMIKGSIAGATGVALLMGGFGTYAVWSDQSTQTGDSITSGELDVAPVAAATLKDDFGVTWNPATDLAVPGDEITRLQSFNFKGTGKNLTGAIRFSPGGETDGAAPTYQAFGSALDIAVTVDGDSVTPGGADWCWDWAAPGFGAKTIATSVVFTFNDVNNQVAQKAKTVLADSTFTITQNDAC